METEKERVSYIIGRQIGTDLSRQTFELDFDLLMSAMKEAYNGEEGQMSEEEMKTAMSEFEAKLQAQQAEIQQAVANENLTSGTAFLKENEGRDGVTTTASGLQYKVLKSGEGKMPTLESSVKAHYEGRLIDGTVFDSSYQRGEPLDIPVSGVIAGWTEALQLMKEGDEWELYIPSQLAYGAQGAGQAIGPNETLLFKIELISVQ